MFAIAIEGDLLPAVPGFVQPTCEGRLDTESWTIECSHQGIPRDWHVIARFREILHECDVVAPEFKSLRIYVLLSGFAAPV
jgi:hypothetical protein